MPWCVDPAPVRCAPRVREPLIPLPPIQVGARAQGCVRVVWLAIGMRQVRSNDLFAVVLLDAILVGVAAMDVVDDDSWKVLDF